MSTAMYGSQSAIDQQIASQTINIHEVPTLENTRGREAMVSGMFSFNKGFELAM